MTFENLLRRICALDMSYCTKITDESMSLRILVLARHGTAAVLGTEGYGWRTICKTDKRHSVQWKEKRVASWYGWVNNA
jgi:hypothetical protein